MNAKQRVVEAVNHMIAAPNYSKLLGEINGIIANWDSHPMTYGGHLSCLNALIDVGLANRTAFDKLVDLIEQKRRLIPEAKRVDYQRTLMQERRSRLAKALVLHEAKAGKLTGPARKKAMTEIQARWKVARDQSIAAKGELSWKERNEAAQEFWEMIDRQLDENVSDAPAPAKRRKK